LYAIAFKHGIDYRDLAVWNGIGAPYRIFAGQELRLRPSATAGVPPPSQTATAMPARAQTAPVEAAPPAPPDRAAVVAVATSPAVEKSTTPQPTPFEDVVEVPPTATPAPSIAATPPVATATPPVPAKSDVVQASKPPAESPAATPPANTTAASAKSAVAAAATHTDVVPELNAGGVAWRWPSDGKVIATYVSGDPTRQGIDVGGQAGDPVRAAADGEVVYSGNGLIGYGELIIVKHNASFLSAYGHNRKRLVKEGDRIKAGQPIAEMGSSSSSRDQLHFEIRKNGKPVNPLEFLPAR